MTDLATRPGADDKAPEENSPADVDDDAVNADEETADDVVDDEAADESVEDAVTDESLEDSGGPADASLEADTEVVDPLVASDHTDVDAEDSADTVVLTGDATTTFPTSSEGASDGTDVYAWAPPEERPRKSRKPLWLGLAAGAALVGLIATSLVLIAPGTSVAGVGVGGLTPGGAADVLQERLAETTIVIVGDGGDAEVTGAELGATVDAKALAEAAFAENPAWNPTRWFAAPVDADVQFDEATAIAALRGAAPDLFVDPVDATLAYDAESAMYVTTPAEEGQGLDTDAVLGAFQDAYNSGEKRVEFDPALAAVEPTTTTEVAEETAASLNRILGTAGFYVGEERTVPIDRAVAASWLTVTHNADGTFAISADESAIQKVVKTLPAAVDRQVVNATVITDSAGGVLREVTAGVAGRTLGDTSKVAADYSAQLASGNGVYKLPVKAQDFTTTALARRIEVDISEQRAYLFENGAVVNSWYISSGLPGHDTNYGHFRIYAKVAQQNMGDRDLIKADYFTPNVPWISYFNGDEALHGAYWHNNFGNRMSHGCVNMPIDAARFVYDWAPIGTEVWVHD
ncbi:L,D-transpeptidase family protein [Microbacterium pumilum]|uniref:L,D-TPase catalytic domain-containing protein n=1 Tax=Microbacterium pumilum TaxID=344165 RepID=A0ABN2SDA5_9MICO